MPDVDLQQIIEAHDQPFVVIDDRYRIVAANQRYCDSYGVKLEAILNRHCYEVSHHIDRPCHENGEQCPHQTLFEKGQASVVLHTHYHADEQPERTRIRGHAIRDQGGKLYLGEILYPLEADSEEGKSDSHMVGHSPAFLLCVDNLARAADSEASILLLGESGVGKELAARFVHDRSSRSGGPFIVINCAAVPEGMFESELFGHERGAFTGSDKQKKGLYELADGGTLFLDEVAEISPPMQAKLLRVLETGEFRRVGGTQTFKAEVRLVSATNQNLLDMVDRKLFRLDLYYRLAGIDVTLPPLRERREDIAALAEALLTRAMRGNQIPCRLDKSAINLLKHYHFPGNVRELRNLLQRAAIRCRNGVIQAEDLDLNVRNAPAATKPETAKAEPPNLLADLEKDYIRDLLDKHRGHRRTVAEQLGVTERTLYRKLKQYGLN